jgi:hypothetical protein
VSAATADQRTTTIPLGRLDKDLQQILTLRSKDRDRIVKILEAEDGIAAAVVPHVVPLLAWDPVAPDAMRALTRIAEEHVGTLIDALLDPNQDFSIRRRLARVFAVCVSQRAADGLLICLDDPRFEVRYQCARSLAAILEKNPRIRIDRTFVFDTVRREAAVGRPVWESHRLLGDAEESEHRMFLDELVKDRASRSLAHVFTLLSLVLPAEPLQVAFRGLHTTDQSLRGTALEYLEGVLPTDIREVLWPFLEDQRRRDRSARPKEEALAELLRSNQSIMLNLKDLERQHATKPDPSESNG